MSEFIRKCEKLGLVSGAVVEVVSVPNADNIGGWEQCSDTGMAEEIGQQFTVNYLADDGITGSDTCYFWPWWSLKLITPSTNKDYTPEPDQYGPYQVGQNVYVDDEVGKILGFDHENDLIHIDVDDDDTYWFHYYDVSEEKSLVPFRLNDEYTATIDAATQTVTVGCQEIAFDKVLELAQKIKNVK